MYIFVKTAKVAGTSLELALREHLGSDDVATPVASYDEEKAAALNYPPPQNFHKEYVARTQLSCARGMFHEHTWAYEIRGMVPREVWDDYFVFTIDRDPLDKSISNYFHYRRPENRPHFLRLLVRRFASDTVTPNVTMLANFSSLRHWLEADAQYQFSQNFYRYSVDDVVIVDKVYDYDDLDSMIAELQEHISANLRLPHVKRRGNKLLPAVEDRDSLMQAFSASEVARKESAVLRGEWTSGQPVVPEGT